MGIHWFLHLDLWFASAWMMTYFGCHILYQLSSSDERLDQECKLRCPHQQNAGATGIQASSWIKGSLRASISGLGSWARPCGEPSALSCAHLQTLGSRAFYNIHMPDRDPHCKQNPNGLLYSTQFHIPPRFLLQGSVLRKHPELLQVAHGLSYKGLSYRSSCSLWPSYISLKFINLKITTFSLESWLLESDLTEAFCHLKLSVLMHLSLFIFFSNYTISRTCKNNVAFFFVLSNSWPADVIVQCGIIIIKLTSTTTTTTKLTIALNISVFRALSSVLSTSQILTHLTLTDSWSRNFYCLHFIMEETEAQAG